MADGKLYITNEDGLTTVLRTGPKFEILAENNFDDYTLSSPAVSDGQCSSAPRARYGPWKRATKN